ncbi:type II toxin-antitoxin system RelE/ParE family toxin [Pelagovum pacificum]|uniref:Type II toxin-antitoxin system RelE/ParE family toxin n=1 Tax=Pelagovum pacificum TaxID=2588711 RepID=A0A5C5GEK2_9RHOB|nr:type II toxin-antitoxin system RelE/ParE family toxin [Pelagovum pacificum]QQA44408.1 type II toxin-antitoxin system RelE/ParE family toxin [Pelagovum pacificum]TNY32477.1 type II toxin-antitoxin system RelE/ParE family toxin [Pelagovum pacificum]
MALEISFAPAAARRLTEIANWTTDTFGTEQAHAYEDMLNERITALAESRVHVRNLTAITGLNRHADYDTVIAGQHLLVFKRLTLRIDIIDILHRRRDLAAWSPQPDEA